MMEALANPTEKLGTFTDCFSPRTVATYNSNDIMVAKSSRCNGQSMNGRRFAKQLTTFVISRFDSNVIANGTYELKGVFVRAGDFVRGRPGAGERARQLHDDAFAGRVE